MSSSDWLSFASICVTIISIIVSAAIAVWVVKKIQAKLDSEQKLKDYFCDELKDIRNGYKGIINDIYNNQMTPNDFKNRMNSLGARATDLMAHLKEIFNIENTLDAYRLELNTIVTESNLYIVSYAHNGDGNLRFSNEFKANLREFEIRNKSIFSDLIQKIYA